MVSYNCCGDVRYLANHSAAVFAYSSKWLWVQETHVTVTEVTTVIEDDDDGGGDDLLLGSSLYSADAPRTFVPHNLISAQGSSKSQQMNPLQVLHQGPLWRELPIYRAFLHISQISHKNSPK
jgi:hypothetical protein